MKPDDAFEVGFRGTLGVILAIVAFIAGATVVALFWASLIAIIAGF